MKMQTGISSRPWNIGELGIVVVVAAANRTAGPQGEMDSGETCLG